MDINKNISPFQPESHAGQSSDFLSDRYYKYKQLGGFMLVLTLLLPCVYCGATYYNSFKLYRHCLKHLPWFFGSIVCCVCKQRFDSKPRLEEHCESRSHTALVCKGTNTPLDIHQFRVEYCELEGISRGSEFDDFLQNYCLHRKVYTNFDRPNGILDRNLFLDPPKKMDTPVQDDIADTSGYQGMLPTSFPVMTSQITVLGEVQGDLVIGQDKPDAPSNSGDQVQDVSGDTTGATDGASTRLENLPEPVPVKRKCSFTSTSPGEQSLLLARLASLENKVDSLGKKVVETAVNQTADLKGKLSKLEDLMEVNCARVQQYSKTLAMVLQKDIGKVMDTVNLIRQTPQAPTVSQEMLKALLTLSQEAVKIYESPYKPGEVKK